MVIVGSPMSTAPPAPTNVRASRRSKTSVDIAWTPVDDPYVDQYIVYRSSSENGDYRKVKNTGLAHYTDRHLEGETYYYYVAMVDKFGIESNPSDIVNNITPDPVPPSVVTVEQLNKNTIQLEWNESLSPYKKRYHVYFSTNGTDFNLWDITYTNHVRDEILTGGTKYYKIALEDDFENVSDFSETVTFTPDSLPAPTNPRVFRNSIGEFVITWDEINDNSITDYLIYRSFDNESFDLIKTTSSVQYTDKYITSSSRYYKIVAKDAYDQVSAESEVASYVISDLNPPANITVSKQSNDLLIRWDEVNSPDVNAYLLYRSYDGESYDLIKKTENIEHIEHNIGTSDRYYKVSTLDSFGQESTTSHVVQYSLNDPSIPDNITVTKTRNNELLVNWNEVLDDDFEHYAIYKSVDGSNYNRIRTTKESEFIDKDIGPDRWYKVTSIDIHGQESAASEIAKYTKDLPSTPSGLAVEAANRDDSLLITWNEIDDEDVDAYMVYRSSDDTNFYLIKITTDRQFIDTELPSATVYYKIASRDILNQESVKSSSVSFALSQVDPPATISVSKKESGNLLVRWDEVTDNKMVAYLLYRSYDGVSYDLIKKTTETEFIDYYSDDNDRYYKVSVEDKIGRESSTSPVAQYSIGDPSIPDNILVSKTSNNTLRLSWSVVMTEDFSHYAIYRSFNGSDYSKIKTTEYTEWEDVDINTTGNYYYVTSVNIHGQESTASEIAQYTKDLPSTPSNLTVASPYENDVLLKWNEVNETDIDSYLVYRSSTGSSYDLIKITSDTQFLDTEVGDSEYYYKVSAKDSLNQESVLSSSVHYVPEGTLTPTNVQVKRATGKAVTITWDKIDNPKFDKFKIYKSSDDDTFNLVEVTEGTEYVDSNLEPGTWYYYVTSRDVHWNESAASLTVSHTINDLLPFKNTLTVTTAGTPIIADVESFLGRKAIEGSLICLGPGKIQIEFSYDGTNYDNPMWLRPEDYYEISSKKDFMEVSKVRLDSDMDNTKVTISVI